MMPLANRALQLRVAVGAGSSRCRRPKEIVSLHVFSKLTVRLRSLVPPRRYRLTALVAILVACAIGKYPHYVHPMVLPANETEHSWPERRVYDEAHFLTPLARWKYEDYLGGFFDEWERTYALSSSETFQAISRRTR